MISLLKVLAVIICIYVAVCTYLYFIQEKLIFFPEPLDKDYIFGFNDDFEELIIQTADGKDLSGLLFKTEDSKGLIFYLHGNAGNLKFWGEVARTYTALNYDVFILDYRGFGKSDGKITSEEQMYADVQIAYDLLKTQYAEDKIIVLGYSLGTGLASKLASVNNPMMLILQAPYYNLEEVMKQRFSYIPTFILKYKFETNQNLKNCKMPIVIFHGELDEVINYESSLKLKKEFSNQINLVTLSGQGHNGITDNVDYKRELSKMLGN